MVFGVLRVCSAAQLLAKMETDEARAERLVQELCQIPVGQLGGVLYVLEDLIKKIKDDGGSRVTKKVGLCECWDEASCVVCLTTCFRCLHALDDSAVGPLCRAASKAN